MSRSTDAICEPAWTREFQNIDQKFDQKFEKLDQKVEHGFDRLDLKIDQAFEKMDAKFERLDAKYESKLETLSTRRFTLLLAVISAAATIAGTVLTILFAGPHGR